MTWLPKPNPTGGRTATGRHFALAGLLVALSGATAPASAQNDSSSTEPPLRIEPKRGSGGVAGPTIVSPDGMWEADVDSFGQIIDLRVITEPGVTQIFETAVFDASDHTGGLSRPIAGSSVVIQQDLAPDSSFTRLEKLKAPISIEIFNQMINGPEGGVIVCIRAINTGRVARPVKLFYYCDLDIGGTDADDEAVFFFDAGGLVAIEQFNAGGSGTPLWIGGHPPYKSFQIDIFPTLLNLLSMGVGQLASADLTAPGPADHTAALSSPEVLLRPGGFSELIVGIGGVGILYLQPNDECEGATELEVADSNVPLDMRFTTASLEESPCLGGPISNADAWYCLRNLTSGDSIVTITTTVDLLVEVTEGCPCPPGPLVGCGLGLFGGLTFTLEAGAAVGVRLINDLNLPPAALVGRIDISSVPVNDACPERLPITEGSIDFSTIGATTDPGDPPFRCADAGNDVWFSYTVPGNGTVTIDTCGSSFDTVLKVYDGSACPPVDDNNLACNDDAPSGDCAEGFSSFVEIAVEAPQELTIRVGGFELDHGFGLLTVEFQPELRACCLPDTTCVETTQITCEAVLGSSFLESSATCASVQCLGACCFGGFCFESTEFGCQSAGLEYLGQGTTCETSTCVFELSGACCLAGACDLMSQADCIAAGADYLGDLVPCQAMTCPGTTFGDPIIISMNPGCGASAVTAADLDGDGDMDVISASEDDHRISWFENVDGAGTYSTEMIISANALGASDVFACDMDGDNDVDVLSASRDDNKIAWYENLGGDPPTFMERVISTGAIGAVAVFAGDLNGDDDIDIISASGGDDKIAWYENLGGDPPAFMEQVISDSANGANSCFAINLGADFSLDVLSASLFNDQIVGYENLGNGTFQAQAISTSANGASDVIACDLDGDRANDVVSTSRNDDKVAWYRNLGAGSFSPEIIITDDGFADGPESVFACDLDGDGDLDIVSASTNNNLVAWYENGPAQSFACRTISAEAMGATSVCASDLDADGDFDVLSASRLDNRVVWYPNMLND